MQNILGYAHTPEATPIIHEATPTLVLLRMTTDTPTKTKTIKQSRSTHCIIYIATSGMCVEVISRLCQNIDDKNTMYSFEGI